MNQSTAIYRLWAKTNDMARKQAKNRQEPVPPWSRHPLPCHLIDVAHVAETWLEVDAHLMIRFCALWPEAAPVDIRRALILTAAVHDLAKVHYKFQCKSDLGWNDGYKSLGQFNGVALEMGYDHGMGVAAFFETFAEYGLPDGVAEAWMSLRPLIHVAAGHHGRLYPCDVDLDYHAIGELAPWIAALLNEMELLFGLPPALPESPPSAFLMLTAGFISIADWIGSDEKVFPHAPNVASGADAQRYVSSLRSSNRVRRTLEAHGLIGRFTPPADFFSLFGFSPYPGFQGGALDTDFGSSNGPEIAIIEAPMGLGKTEIALALAARAIRNSAADGLYTALPTQATANALFLRIRAFTDRIRHTEAPLALMLAHGARRFFEDYQEIVQRTRRIPFFRTPSYQDPVAPPAEIVAPAWVQSSKRALLAPAGLGTIDQALLGAMGVRHSFVRLFALARKVVIIDEVHSYDVYMGVLLERLLEWLAALGAKVILLSATLASSARNRLLEAFGAMPPGTLPVRDYPLMIYGMPNTTATALAGEIPEVLTHLHKTIRVIPVEPEAVQTDGDPITDAGVAWVRAAVDRGGCIAWIRNTVRQAQVAWRHLRAAGIEAELLHARFTRTDRNAKEEDLFDALGSPKRCADRGTNRPDHRVVVATQVIEQSVDVDFDAMLSDLAPVDLLLQRVGRLWRHDRPAEVRQRHETPVLAVLMPGAGDRAALRFGPSAYVYDAETLARSAVLVHQHPSWPLPDACRMLVTELYDEPWDAGRLGCTTDALEKARSSMRHTQARMEQQAKKALVSRPDTPIPSMREARRDLGDNDGSVHLGTRYESFRTVAVVLCRETDDGCVGIGRPDLLLTPPADDDYASRLNIEAAIALSSVSFPWNRDFPEIDSLESLASFVSWWVDTHPYDDRRFVVLDLHGCARIGEVSLRYTLAEGLVVERASVGEPTDSIPHPEELDT